MKKLISIFLLFSLVFSFSCKQEKAKEIINKNNISSSAKHYICANKCENSGSDVAGNCPTCKTPYTHNQAFHNGEFLKSGPIKVQSNTPLPNSNTNTLNNTVEPAQNINGVYHYTCENGCNGGSGTASQCVSCGKILVHNTLYHN